MGRKARIKKQRRTTEEIAVSSDSASPRRNAWLWSVLVGVVIGAVLTIAVQYRPDSRTEAPIVVPAEQPPTCRSVEQLLAMEADELEQVTLAELNLAVARGIPALADADLASCRDGLNSWIAKLYVALATIETDPDLDTEDPVLTRLQVVAAVVDQEATRRPLVDPPDGDSFADPAAIFVPGAVEQQISSAFTRPLLYVLLGRRIGMPVHLSAVGDRWMCRCDDGKAAYDIESPDDVAEGFRLYTGTPAPAASDPGRTRLPARRVTHAEAFGLFLALRARQFEQTEQWALAESDVLRAYQLCPTSPAVYEHMLGFLVERGRSLYTGRGLGAMARRFGGPGDTDTDPVAQAPGQRDPREDIRRIMELNAANQRRIGLPGPGMPAPSVPGLGTSPVMPQPPVPPRPVLR